jgi:hypothetical protein
MRKKNERWIIMQLEVERVDKSFANTPEYPHYDKCGNL